MKPTGSLVNLTRLALTLLLLLGLMGTQLARSAPGSEPAQDSLRPLETLLNTDGSLDLSTGFSGTLDPAGYRLEYASDGEPIFVEGRPAAPLVPNNTWHALGAGPGGDVNAVAVAGPDVYVGGDFTGAGGVTGADNIARWGTVYSYVYLPLALRQH